MEILPNINILEIEAKERPQISATLKGRVGWLDRAPANAVELTGAISALDAEIVEEIDSLFSWIGTAVKQERPVDQFLARSIVLERLPSMVKHGGLLSVSSDKQSPIELDCPCGAGKFNKRPTNASRLKALYTTMESKGFDIVPNCAVDSINVARNIFVHKAWREAQSDLSKCGVHISDLFNYTDWLTTASISWLLRIDFRKRLCKVPDPEMLRKLRKADG